MTKKNNRDVYYGYIYIISNKINGKTYIGQRRLIYCTKTPETDGYMGSGKYIRNAENKYGIENFTKEILAVCYSKDILNILEIEYIKLYKEIGKAEYNIAGGGNTLCREYMTEEQKLLCNKAISNGIRNSEKWYEAMHSEEHSRKLSEASKGRVSPNKGKRMGEDFCNNVSRAIKALYDSDRGEKIKEKIKAARANQVITEEMKKKMSESHKGRIVSEETREKLRVVNTGKIVSEDTKRKIREARAEQVFTPEQEEKRREGVKRFWDSEEGLKLRKVNSERSKGRPSNSKGKHWYNNGEKNVLAFECPDGFVVGKLSDYHPSEETKRKQGSWIKSLTPEELAAYKAKLSESHKGAVFTEEICRKISEAKKGKPGRKQSEEIKRKISESLKGRKCTWGAREDKVETIKCVK